MDLTVAQRAFVALAMAAIVGGLTVGLYGRAAKSRPLALEPIYSPPATPAEPTTITVYVSGAVQTPGLKVLARGARVADALAAAGGCTSGADTTQINLAAPLDDGQRIDVPTRSISGSLEAAPFGKNSTSEPARPSQLLNLNTATATDLEALPGIGPTLAQAIVEYRQRVGGFRRVEDLEGVPGIGPKRLAQIKRFVTVQ